MTSHQQRHPLTEKKLEMSSARVVYQDKQLRPEKLPGKPVHPEKLPGEPGVHPEIQKREPEVYPNLPAWHLWREEGLFAKKTHSRIHFFL
jgi:hypothetical protein